MPYRNYTDADVIAAFHSSDSIRQILEKIGLKPAGGNYANIKNKLKLLGLDQADLRGQAWNRGKVIGPTRPIEYYLVRDSKSITSHHLRKRLIREGLKEAICEGCGLDKWLGLPIPLELEHKDGDHHNNLIENLEILCPNCHALTDTYRGKNIGKLP